MAHHAAERSRVANLSIELGRVAQVSEEHGQRSDGNLLAGSQCFGRKQIAEHLQRRYFSRRRRLIAPLESFENHELFGVSLVLQVERELFVDMQRAPQLQPFVESVTCADVSPSGETVTSCEPGSSSARNR